MSILLSGDFHAGLSGELYVINKRTLMRKYRREKFNAIKFHIILGDGCFMWPNNEKNEEKIYMELLRRPFSILSVLGNHEPIYGNIYGKDIHEIDIGIGETVYQVRSRPFVAYLKRGKIYNIDGFKFLVLGGALSVDKEDQMQRKTWWENEYWSEKEKQDVFTLLKTENQFDYVLSHTGPERVNKLLFQYPGNFPKLIQDEVALLNDQIDAQIQYRDWFCGHFHRDIYHFDINAQKGYQYLFRTTKILDKVDDHFVVYNEFGNTKRII